MNRDELLTLVALGEDSGRQFKADITNADSLAADLVAFSNSSGGVVLIGVADDGTLPGLTSADVRRLNQLIANAATQHMISAPIRLFIFDDRIEIVSPGHLPDHLTVEHIRAGNSNIRNPILVSHVAKGLLPYRGLGSGIQWALEEWPEIGFVNDRDGCLFTATVRRTAEQETAAGRVTGEVTKLLQALENGQMLRVEAQRALGLKSQANFRDRYLKPALDAGLIEMTIPDKPNSRLQKYRLTEVGRRLLIDAHRGEDE